MIDTFQCRDDGGLYEVIGETDDSVTLRAYDEAHTVSTIARAEFDAHFDPTARALVVDAVTADGAGGVRLACGEHVVHLTAAKLAEVVAASSVP